MNMAHHYRLADGVAIRPERFGALVYRHDTRRLYFLHSPEIAAFVLRLDGQHSLEEALGDFVTDRGLPAAMQETLANTLARLEALGLVAPRP